MDLGVEPFQGFGQAAVLSGAGGEDDGVDQHQDFEGERSRGGVISRCTQAAATPLSTGSATPVTERAASEAR